MRSVIWRRRRRCYVDFCLGPNGRHGSWRLRLTVLLDRRGSVSREYINFAVQ